MTTIKMPLNEGGLARAAATKKLKGYGNLTAKARKTLLADSGSAGRLTAAATRHGMMEDDAYDPQTNQVRSANTMSQNIKAISNPGKATRGFRR